MIRQPLGNPVLSTSLPVAHSAWTLRQLHVWIPLEYPSPYLCLQSHFPKSSTTTSLHHSISCLNVTCSEKPSSTSLYKIAPVCPGTPYHPDLFPSSHKSLWDYILFLIKFIGGQWLISSCRFQAYNSMMHHLYIALCAHPPKSDLLLSLYVWPLLPFTVPPMPFSLTATTLLSVSEHFCLFICHAYSCVAFSFISHLWVTSYGS